MSDPTELKRLRGDAATLIRRHLWQSKRPPNSGGRVWHMGRDLSIWNALVREGEDPETVNGAIAKVRALTNISGPMTLHIFYSSSGKTRPIFEQAKSKWLAEQKANPQTFKQILGDMADA